MEQSITRRRILTLSGGGLAGLVAVAGASGTAVADRGDPVRQATERGYHPLTPSGAGRARIAHADAGSAGGARVEATLDRRWVDENGELVVLVRASVDPSLLGRRRVLRVMMIGDNGDPRMETVGPDVRLDHPAFEVEISLGRSHPIRDWNLIPERIFAARVSLNILDTGDFAVSDDFLFKVRRI